MSGYLTDIEIADPHLIPQSIWENFPARQKILLTEREFSSQEWARRSTNAVFGWSRKATARNCPSPTLARCACLGAPAARRCG